MTKKFYAMEQSLRQFRDKVILKHPRKLPGSLNQTMAFVQGKRTSSKSLMHPMSGGMEAVIESEQPLSGTEGYTQQVLSHGGAQRFSEGEPFNRTALSSKVLSAEASPSNPFSSKALSSPFNSNYGHPMGSSFSHPTTKSALLSPFAAIRAGQSDSFSFPYQASFNHLPEPSHQFSHSAFSVGPEFSAPTEFRVEPFELELLDRLTDSTKASGSQSYNQQTGSTFSGQQSTYGQGALSPFNAAGKDTALPHWMSQAKEDMPEKISESAKQALNGSMSVAKEDFEKDLAAILGHEALPSQPTASGADAMFQNAQNSGSTENRASPTAQTPNAQQPDEVPAPHPTHDIFDKMGMGLSYANSFDLGSINLNDRFEAYEQALGIEHQDKGASKGCSVSMGFETQALTGTASRGRASEAYVSAEQLDDFDLMAELAHIGASPEVLSMARTAQLQHSSRQQLDPVPEERATLAESDLTPKTPQPQEALAPQVIDGSKTANQDDQNQVSERQSQPIQPDQTDQQHSQQPLNNSNSSSQPMVTQQVPRTGDAHE